MKKSKSEANASRNSDNKSKIGNPSIKGKFRNLIGGKRRPEQKSSKENVSNEQIEEWVFSDNEENDVEYPETESSNEHDLQAGEIVPPPEEKPPPVPKRPPSKLPPEIPGSPTMGRAPTLQASFLQIPVFDRTNRALSEIDHDIYSRTILTKLYLSRNQIRRIPPQIADLVHLRIVDLSYNQLAVIPPEMCQLHALEELLLGGNHISVFPHEIHQWTALTKLDLKANRLKYFPVAVTSIPNLLSLDLSRNQISHLPLELQYLTSLTSLNVNHNVVQRISPKIRHMASLRNLWLSNNRLNSIPESLQLSTLKELHLADNQIEEAPLWVFSSLLQVLNLSGNSIVLENSIDSAAAELRELYLKSNRIRVCPTLRSCTNLVTLDLSGNELQELPDIGELVNLSKLLLADNHLASLPPMAKLSNLRLVNASGNLISNIAPQTFPKEITHLLLGYNQITDLSWIESEMDLEELHVGGNPIESLPDSLWTCTKLQILQVNNAQLKELSEGVGSLTKLISLNLGDNQISSLPSALLQLVDLLALDVSANQLQTLPDDLLQSLSRLNFLNLADNDFKEIQGIDSLLERECHVALEGNPIALTLKEKFSELQLPNNVNNTKIGWAEMMGKRGSMEDAFILQGNYLEDERNLLLGVFDGHAGSAASRYCAQHLPNVLRSKMETTKDPIKALKETFHDINQQFRESPEAANARHCGSTGLVVLIMDKKLYIANVGDTRALLCRKNEVLRLSFDHKPTNEEDRIIALGGYVIGEETLRVDGVVAVARSFGDYFMEPFINAEPFVDEVDLAESEEFLILACDGVWDEIEDEKAAQIVASVQEPHKASIKLRDTAYLRGSDDNISVIVARLH